MAFETADYTDYSARIENAAPENTGVEAPAGVAFLSMGEGTASAFDGGVFKFSTNLAGSFLL